MHLLSPEYYACVSVAADHHFCFPDSDVCHRKGRTCRHLVSSTIRQFLRAAEQHLEKRDKTRTKLQYCRHVSDEPFHFSPSITAVKG